MSYTFNSMSARVSRGAPSRGRNVQRRKMVLDVDLNVPLPAAESFNGEGTSSYPPSPERVQGDQAPASQEVGGGQNSALGQSEGGHLGVPPPPVTIDVDSIDDDVIVSSPRAFAEAKQNNRRNRGRTIVDVDLEDSARHAATSCNKRRRPPCQTYIDIDNLEWSINSVGDAMKSKAQARFEQLPPPPPPEPTFSCPVCMGPLVEEMSTKCGHIFCKACIKAAIAAQKKCPTCRRKLTMKDTIRIYLPAAS